MDFKSIWFITILVVFSWFSPSFQAYRNQQVREFNKIVRHVNKPRRLARQGAAGLATAKLQLFNLKHLCVAGVLLHGNGRKHAQAECHGIKTFFTSREIGIPKANR